MRLAVALLALSACSNAPRAPLGPPEPHLVVSDPDQDLRVDDLFYHADIPFRYANQTPDTVVITGCRPPPPPTLEWWDGMQWRLALYDIRLGCLSAPFVIPQGRVINDTLHIRVSRDSLGPDGRHVRPYWLASRGVGEYRLVWPLKTQGSVADRAAFRGGALRPLAERVSNTFRLRPRREAAPQN